MYPLDSHAPRLSRRHALRLAGATGGLAAAAACSSGGGGANAVTKIQKLRLPARAAGTKRVPGEVIAARPDVPAAYTRFPRPFKTVTDRPGTGGTVSTFQITYTAPPPSHNRWLSELDKRLNVTVKPTLAQPAGFAQKTAALIAGGDMPDIFYVNIATGQAPVAAQSILQGAFTDLTDYLAGDAIKEYPNLALFPSYAWQNSSLAGRLYGVPRPEPLLQSGLPQMRLDWMRKLGMDMPKNADELYHLLVGFAKGDPDGNGKDDTWAFSSLQIYWQTTPILNMFGVPNNWRLNKDGSFTKDIETDEFEAATRYMVKLWKAGAFHPNSAASTYEQQTTLWNAGKIAVWGAQLDFDYSPAVASIPGVKNGARDLGPLIPPGRDGGIASLYQSSGIFGMYSIPAKVGKSKARVRELLRILNYVGAPFGSEENTFMTYGIEGWNFSYKNGVPTPSSNPARGAELAASYYCQPNETVLYIPGPPNQSLKAQKTAEELVPKTLRDPTVNLISQTQISKGPALQQSLNDAFVGIVTGRKPFSALQDLRQNWTTQGGEQIRREYHEALQKTPH